MQSSIPPKTALPHRSPSPSPCSPHDQREDGREEEKEQDEEHAHGRKDNAGEDNLQRLPRHPHLRPVRKRIVVQRRRALHSGPGHGVYRTRKASKRAKNLRFTKEQKGRCLGDRDKLTGTG